jgi:signal transduction histidine kinase
MRINLNLFKIIIAIVLSLKTVFLFSQPVFKDNSPRLFLEYYLYESEFAKGKYIEGDFKELGFIRYNHKEMPKAKPANDRMITLRSEFIIDSSNLNKDVYIVTLPYDYACNIFFNGKTIAFKGNITDGYTNRTHTSEKTLLPPDLIRYGYKNEIAFQLYPKEGENNPFGKSFISNAKDANKYVYIRNSFGPDLIVALSACGIVFSIFFFFTYISRKEYMKMHFLFFACMNLFFIVSYLNNIVSHNFANTFIIEKIARAGFPLFMFVGNCFLLDYTNVFKKKRVFKLILAIIYIPAVILVVIPKTTTGIIAAWNSYPLIVLMLGNVLMLVITLLFYRNERHFRAFFLFLAMLINLFFGIYDGYVFAVLKTKPFVLMTPNSVFLINLIIFIILVVDHAKLYHLALERTEQLKLLNEKLEKTVEERTKRITEYSQKLQIANTTKDKFFSIIAHDLKNPFNTLIGFSEILKNSFDELTEDEVYENLNIIHSTSKNGYVLLDNLLQWAQTQTNQIKFNPELIRLKSAIQECIDGIENQSQFKDIEIVNKVLNNHTIIGDINQIKTIVRNLISNAIKYTTRNGLILVKSEIVGENMQISVKDTGVGIPESDLKNLFQLDRIFSTPGTNQEKGSGLGLVLCKEFVEMHGGKIWAESMEGNGSEFIFTIPINN